MPTVSLSCILLIWYYSKKYIYICISEKNKRYSVSSLPISTTVGNLVRSWFVSVTWRFFCACVHTSQYLLITASIASTRNSLLPKRTLRYIAWSPTIVGNCVFLVFFMSSFIIAPFASTPMTTCLFKNEFMNWKYQGRYPFVKRWIIFSVLTFMYISYLIIVP